MASKRKKVIIFRIGKKIADRGIEKGNITLTWDISASEEARNFLKKKNKVIYIEKSKRWAQSGFCSLSRLEMASKRVDLLWKSWASKNYKKNKKISSSLSMKML